MIFALDPKMDKTAPRARAEAVYIQATPVIHSFMGTWLGNRAIEFLLNSH